MNHKHPRRILAGALTVTALSGCATTTPTTTGAASASSATVTVTNCGQQQTFPSPAKRLFVNDSNMIATTLAVGAASQVVGVTSLEQDKPHLEEVYGKDVVDGLPDLGKDYISMEKVLAVRPDVVYAGYNYGFSEAKNFMPESLRAKGIAPYVLSESCRPTNDNKQRGTMDPWTAVRTDLTNLGTITGHADKATAVITDMDTRLARLKAAPQAAHRPVILLFDSGKDNVFTSGSFGAPQGIIDAAGATNLAADVKDSWVSISWEKAAAGKPDLIALVDYPGATIDQKIAALEANPATRDLPAVKQKRFLALPYMAWTSNPLNIDAAESLRQPSSSTSWCHRTTPHPCTTSPTTNTHPGRAGRPTHTAHYRRARPATATSNQQYGGPHSLADIAATIRITGTSQ